MFLLGFVMDAFEIIFVVVPIVAPALLQMPGVDPVWLGIMMAMNLQTSYMHPPLGPTLFFLRGVAPPEITTRDIYVGIIPFVLIQLVRAGGAVVRAGACDRAAACALWRDEREAWRMKAAEHVRPQGPRGAGDRRVERAWARTSPRCWPRTARRWRWWRAAPTGSRRCKDEIEKPGGKRRRHRGRRARPRRDDARLRRSREGVRHRHHPGQQCRRRACRPRRRDDRGRMAARARAPISTRCSSGRRKRARRMLAAKQEGRDRQHRLGARLRRRQGRRRLCHRQGRRGPDHQGAGARARLQGRARQRHRAGLVRHRDQPTTICTSEAGATIKRDIPIGRFGKDGDLDGALLLLASDAGRYITGATIVVDGGQMVRLRGSRG